MVKKTITVGKAIENECRPVAILVQMASKFESQVHIESDDNKINAKSIMGMMTLAIKSGLELVLEADGTDEEKALEELGDYLSRA